MTDTLYIIMYPPPTPLVLLLYLLHLALSPCPFSMLHIDVSRFVYWTLPFISVQWAWEQGCIYNIYHIVLPTVRAYLHRFFSYS